MIQLRRLCSQIQMTTYYIASIDASRIDQDSKTEVGDYD